MRNSRRRDVGDAASELRTRLPTCLQRAVDLAQERGASSWLTALPIQEFGFTLHKSAFRDAIALRYGWSPLNTPSHCSCGSQFSVQHALSCPKGGFPPLVLSLTGGMGSAATVCYKRLASLIAQKRDQPYSRTMAWVRCSLSFALLRSSIQCIRGARSSIGRMGRELLPPVDLVTSEAKLPV